MTHFMSFFFVTAYLIFSLTGLVGCKNDTPIKIGFSGGLTGRHSDLGLYGRNGVLLAIEEANRDGGINGRPVVLIAKDDQQKPEVAVKVDQELIDEGVIAIIGHFTSAMSVAAAPHINRQKMLMISPTTATNLLSGQDDYFVRLMSPGVQANEKLASYIFDKLDLQNVVIVYDDQNQAYSLDWVNSFNSYSVERKRTVTAIPFLSGRNFSFTKEIPNIIALKPDGLLMVAAALDAAMLCQQIRKSGADFPIFSTMWSMSDEFIQHGGNAIEGVTFANWFDPAHPGKASQQFQQSYKDRFGRAPTFASNFAYETARILIQSLRISDDPHNIKETILRQQEFEGTQGSIRFDKYGDPTRDLFLMTVKDGQFVRVE